MCGRGIAKCGFRKMAEGVSEASVMALPSEGTCHLLSVECSAKRFVSWHEMTTKKPFRGNRLMGELPTIQSGMLCCIDMEAVCDESGLRAAAISFLPFENKEIKGQTLNRFISID